MAVVGVAPVIHGICCLGSTRNRRLKYIRSVAVFEMCGGQLADRWLAESELTADPLLTGSIDLRCDRAGARYGV